jgi:hypothetical protein
MNQPTPYPDLNSVLRILISGVRTVLGDNFVGAWLQGSFAVGDFDRFSDVDFVIAMREELTEGEVQTLQDLHGQIHELDSEWAQHLEGSYFPSKVLRDYRHRGKPLWYLDHGSSSLIRSDHCNMILVRWIVRNQGITLAGPAGETVVDPIPIPHLREEIRSIIVEWGNEILADPDRFRNRFYQGYLVLNFCRMLHDLIQGQPGSKRAGAEWGKANLDSAWSGLIDRAWDCRPNPAVSVRTPPDASSFEATLRFVQFIIEESERRLSHLG